MSVFTIVDPDILRPMPGKAIVRIIEILGGTSPGGIYTPGHLQAHMGKDTFYGELIKLGPPPRTEHYKSGPGPGWDVRENRSGVCWSAEVMANFKIGDVFVFPRDVELVFTWNEHRFCIVHIHEAILGIPRDQFDASGFEVVPWIPPKLPEGGDPDENKSEAELLDELEEELFVLETELE